MKRRAPVARTPALAVFDEPAPTVAPEVDRVEPAAAVLQRPVPPRLQPMAPDELDVPTAVREVLGYPLRLLSGLPLPSTLLCRREGAPGAWQLVVLTTSRTAYVAARERGVAAFVGGEFELLALSTEHDRAPPVEVSKWLDRKVADPDWRLAGGSAIGQLAERPRSRGWTVAAVLRALDMQLLAVSTGDELPAGLQGGRA